MQLLEYKADSIADLARSISVEMSDLLQSAQYDKRSQFDSYQLKRSISVWSQNQLFLDPISFGCHPEEIIGLEELPSSVDRLVLTLSVQLTKVLEINNSFDKKHFRKTCTELERWMRQEYYKLAEQADNLICQQVRVFERAGHGYLTLLEANQSRRPACRSGISLDGGSGVKSGMSLKGTSSSIKEPEYYTVVVEEFLSQSMLFLYRIAHFGRIQADVEYTNWITFDRNSHETWRTME